MFAELLHGFESDFNMLIRRFEEGNSLRFIKFAEIWRDMNFSLVFLGNRPKEDIFFAIEALSFIKSYFIKTSNLIRKVGAMYALYGIYYKQPILDAGKILITTEEWIEVKRFIAELQDSDHYDTLYIILKLVFSNAFAFSLLPQKQLSIVPHNELDSILLDFPPVLDTAGLENLFEELTDVETEYETAKGLVAESANIPAINYCEQNFSDVLQQILREPEKPGPSTTQTNTRQAFRQRIYRKRVTTDLYKSVVFDDSSESDSE